jgi:transposase
MKKISAAKRANIISLLKRGCSIRKISAMQKVGTATVCRIRKKNTRDLQNRNLGGRPRSLSLQQERNLVRNVNCGTWTNAAKANHYLRNDYRINVTTKTVRNTIKRNGLAPYVKHKKPYLSKKHRQKRLQFARKYKEWTAEDWKKVVWTDESKFTLFYSNRREYYWKKSDAAFRNFHVQPTMKYGGGL